MIISFVDLPSNSLNANTIKGIHMDLLASIERAGNQIKWAEAVAAWAKSIEIEFVVDPRTSKQVTAKQLSRLVASLPEDVKALGEVTAVASGHGWTEFDLIPSGKDFETNSTFNFHSETSGYGNRVSRIYLHDAPQMIAGLRTQIDNSTNYLKRLDDDLKAYNKAAKKVAEAQQLLKSIVIPYRVEGVSSNMALLKDLRHIHQKG